MVEKMRDGKAVPKLTHQESMGLMLEVLKDDALHMRAAEGYKKVGQSNDSYGKHYDEVCREAGAFWHEETTDNIVNMRVGTYAELATVAEDYASGESNGVSETSCV